jgi:large subunit ribosomal protein L15
MPLSRAAAPLLRAVPRLAGPAPLCTCAAQLAPLALSATRRHAARLHSAPPAFSALEMARPLPEHIPTTDMGPLALNKIRDNYGARLKKTRVGRGIGSGRGRKSGRGMKGLRARAGNHGFLKQSGGQTSMISRIPKRGFHRPKKEYVKVNLDELQSWLLCGRLPTPTADHPLTVKHLFDAKLVTLRTRHSGLLLLGRGGSSLEPIPIHIEAQVASQPAIAAIEATGGSVRTVYYSQLALRALLKPENFERKGRLLPRPALPPPKLMLKYMDREKRGYLADLEPGDVVRPQEHPPHVNLKARNVNATSPVKLQPRVGRGEGEEGGA